MISTGYEPKREETPGVGGNGSSIVPGGNSSSSNQDVDHNMALAIPVPTTPDPTPRKVVGTLRSEVGYLEQTLRGAEENSALNQQRMREQALAVITSQQDSFARAAR